MTPSSAPFHGWRAVAAAFVVAVFGWGLGFYGPPVYLEAVRAARGWPLSLVSGAVTVHFLAGVLVVANLGRLHARFGLAASTLAGAVLLALGVLGWALAREPWQLYGAAVISGAGWVAMGAAAVNAIVSPWFARGRPAALAAAYNGASLGGVIFSPLLVALVARGGFPAAAALVGGVMVAAIAALALTVLGRTPESTGQRPDGDRPDGPAPVGPDMPQPSRLGSPWGDPAFLTLALGMALALFAQIGLIAHLVSLLGPSLGPQGAGLAAGLSTAAAILGRTLVGWLMPASAERRTVAAASLGCQVLGCAALALGSQAGAPLLVLGVVLVGLGIGNATSLPPLVAQAEFAREDVPRVVGLVVAAAQAAYAFAPALFGWLREAAPDGAVYAAAAAIQAAAAAAYLGGRGLHRRRAEPPAAAEEGRA